MIDKVVGKELFEKIEIALALDSSVLRRTTAFAASLTSFADM